jgi:hypothetical protein
MKNREIIEAQNSDTDKEVKTSYRKKPSVLARAGVAAAVGTGAIVGLSACTAEEVKPLEPEYKVGNVMLEADLAASRQHVLELCNTGEGAEEVKQAWEDFGYQERSNMEWMDALKYVGDFEYHSDPNAIVNYGSYTYPTTEALAKNCVDVAFLLSQSPMDVAYPETALPLLEEFHNTDSSDPVIPLERIFNTIESSRVEAASN